MPLSVHFVTLGCPKNEVDTDAMRAAVERSSYGLADALEDADVAVVNTCSFIKEATEESVEAVLDLAADWKAERAGRRVVVAGCMASRYGADLSSAMPEADAFVPVSDEDRLLEVIEQLTGAPAGAPKGSVAEVVLRTVPGASAYVQVADGCHRSCAYCTIPAIRGPYRSRSLEDVVREARMLTAAGAKEIVLIGQDVSAYGRDRDDRRVLADVVRALTGIDELDWLRLMYVQPDGVSDELLAAMASSEKVCRYLDIPLQHASRDVLRRMRRSGDAASFLRLLDRVRSALPGVTLRTTVISGFPGESREDARLLQEFIAEARFDYLGVFPYSREEGTEAATMPDQVPKRTMMARAQRLRDLADEIGFERAAEHIGETLEVLVEGSTDDEGPFGRWRGQAPEIDGIVMLDRELPAGTLTHVRVTDAAGYDLIGEVT